MKQFYVEKNFRQGALDLIYVMNAIVNEYIGMGLNMTVRQLYYQLVSKALIENTEQSYKRVTGIVNDAKLAGLMDWEAMEDRTRSFDRIYRWSSGADHLKYVSKVHHQDMWSNQLTRVYVVVEKEALVGVLQDVCREYDIPLLAARGYPSGTVLREFAESDLIKTLMHGQNVRIVHLGDHDPSGIDMSRDLDERLRLFSGIPVGEDYYDHDGGGYFEFSRVALSMDQIEDQRPPPNPAKSTDSRFLDYRKKYGSKSWELDALRPEFLSNLVRLEAKDVIDPDNWDRRVDEVANVRKELGFVSKAFDKKGI